MTKLAVCFMLMLGLSGCDTPAHGEPPPEPFLREHYQQLSDGRVVLCLYRTEWMASYGGGPTMECDWANAK